MFSKLLSCLIFLAVFTHSSALADDVSKTGEQIQDEFKKIGNRKTRILISKQGVYNPFKLDVYLKDFVTPLELDLAVDDRDGVEIIHSDGTKVGMLPVAAAWFELKAVMPFSDAGLAYWNFGDQTGAVFVMRAAGGKYLSISKSKVLNVISIDGRLGVKLADVFLAFDRIEFDLPPDFKLNNKKSDP